MTHLRTFDYYKPNYMDKYFGKDSSEIYGHQASWTVPSVNIINNNENLELHFAAPGYKKEDFKIVLDNYKLTISAQQEEKKKEQINFKIQEFSYSSWQKSYELPKLVETEKIEAQYENGILKVVIPKKEEAKVKEPKTITIK